MISPQAKAIESQLQLMREECTGPFDLQKQRENARNAHELTGVPIGVTHVSGQMAGVPVLRAVPDNDQGRFSIVFLHGGAFCLMSAWTHHRFAGYIAQACKAQVISPDYSLAPEKPFPRALSECVSVITAAREGHPRSLIALVGDSAGGGLALSALLQMRDSGAALPFGAVLMAPWLDLTLSSPSVKSAAKRDVILIEENLREMAELYTGGEDLRAPRVSPVYGNFAGLPPLYVQASGNDLLRDDCTLLRDAYIAQGLELQYELFADMFHCFQFYAGKMPEAEHAIGKAAGFLKGACDKISNVQF